MTYAHRDLQLTFEPGNGWAHFVLYTEPTRGIAGGGFNATASFERITPYVKEWLGRLERCEPNSLHTTLVRSDKIPELFHPCVHEDGNSPSAVGGSGCMCYQTFYDPEFGFPVVANHYRTVSGNIETWKYLTYTPLELRQGDTFGALIIDGRHFWVRTGEGLLALLPEANGHGYGVGYGGGGPHQLALYIGQLIDSDGRETAAHAHRHDQEPDPQIMAWVSSQEATRRQELTLNELKRIQAG